MKNVNFTFLNVLGFSGWVAFSRIETTALLEIARPGAAEP